jgi:hypothetical protein
VRSTGRPAAHGHAAGHPDLPEYEKIRADPLRARALSSILHRRMPFHASTAPEYLAAATPASVSTRGGLSRCNRSLLGIERFDHFAGPARALARRAMR